MISRISLLPPRPSIETYGLGELLANLFWTRISQREFSFFTVSGWNATLPIKTSDMSGVLSRFMRGKTEQIVAETDSLTAYLTVDSGDRVATFHLEIAAYSAEAARAYIDELKKLWPPVELDKGFVVLVRFLSLKGNRHRFIDVPPWEQIRENYPNAAGLDGLMAMRSGPPKGTGQLLLWHGPPGTGKTYAIRSLMWEWRDWARFHYVTDPEEFFGRTTAYMMNALMDAGEDVDPEEVPSKKAKWTVFVAEDTGEMLTSDAKERVGQGLSRLLNVVDGLLGQGLRVLVLLTTNEKIEKLHPAVARPGRCFSNEVFEAFTPAQAEAWLRKQGVSGGVARAQSLAELYATLAGRRAASTAEKKVVGF